jgi:glutamate-ammonia-ligase adenylyltransferase
MTSDLPPKLDAHLEEKWRELQAGLAARAVDLPNDANLIDCLRGGFAFSDFVANTCIREPAMLVDLIDTGDLIRRYDSGNEYRHKVAHAIEGLDAPSRLERQLRRLRRREMVRIALRDLGGLSDVFETMGDLTAFADSMIQISLDYLYEHQAALHGSPVGKTGAPVHPVVIGLGKLGGEELNFSSDVDLIFTYSENGHTAGGDASLSNEEFFARLFRNLYHLLGKKTEDGCVFRVDLRLRPFGENGPMAMSFDSMEHYYQTQGREWERYAWIKARVAAGDFEAGTRLLHRLAPFVFRRYLDFGAFESLRDMKNKIEREVKRKGLKDNIKLGWGGIREIEFFGQIFQLIRGGVSALLQQRSILKVLPALVTENLIPEAVCANLTEAYIFLRKLEHRLQEVDDQQIHQLPTDEFSKMRLACAMGFADADAFSRRLDRHRTIVHKQFRMLLQAPDSEKPADPNEQILASLWHGILDLPQAESILEFIGFPEPDETLRILDRFRNDLKSGKLSAEGRRRLDKLMPLLLRHVGAGEDPLTTLKRIVDLLKAIEGRAAYLALLLENPGSLTQLVKLSGASSLIAGFLSRHPVLLDELLDPRSLYAPPKHVELETELRNKLARLSDDFEFQMDALRIFKQVNVLHVAAADVTEVLPLMRVSDHLSDIAEVVLNEVIELAWNHLKEKHGEPVCELDGQPCEKGFAVIAYGKLGGLELGYGSDLDLVFLHSASAGQTRGSAHPIDNTHFFARLGQRVVHILTAHTRAGILYETDMRLRPSGISGMLVSHIAGFRDYQIEDAWTWEHQALIRARAVGGDPLLRKRFEEVRKATLTRRRDPRTLRTDVVDMRRKMRRELLKPEEGVFDLKQDNGGIVDIEFLVQFLVLLHAHRHPALVDWTDNVRLIQTLITTGVIDEFDAHILKHAYLIYRALAHKLSLQEKAPRVPAGKLQRLREKVTELWQQHLD